MNQQILPYILSIIFCLSLNSAFGQVYNYFPLRYSSIDANPTFTSSNLVNNRLFVGHVNSFNADAPFHSTQVEISHLFEKHMFGLGLIANHTQQNDSIHYSYGGLAASYRNILFDVVFWRIGINYKLTDAESPSGFMTRFNFTPDPLNPATKHPNQSVNLSTTFSSGRERVYLTAAVMNLVPSWDENSEERSLFPRYFYVKIGNLLAAIGSKNRELSSLLIWEEQADGEYAGAYQITYLGVYNLTRKSNLRYGGDLAYHDLGYLQLRPTLAYTHALGYKRRYGNYRHFEVRVWSDIASLAHNEFEYYKPVYALNATYTF